MTTAIFSALIRRFVWKEYRTVRGLWLAVLVVGLLVDWVCGVLLTSATDWATLRLCVALASATLYAAGAAAILFAMEHEEQTYEFLRGLPATWRSMFVGKLLFATSSAIALAAVLSLMSLMVGGFRWPAGNNASLALGVFGVTIFEAIAWGTLCSLVFKRPLAAAIMTLVVGALAVHLAVNSTSAVAVASGDPQSYLNAVPLRIAIVVIVLGIAMLVARNWLVMGSGSTNSSSLLPFGWLAALRSHIATPLGRVSEHLGRSRRGSMLVRLVWQSWRESWKFLPLPIVAGASCIVISMIADRLRVNAQSHAKAIGVVTMFFGPALFGALAFSADQRRNHVRFLAEHAAAPRWVWLSRHMVWLGTLAVIMTLLTLVVAAIAVVGLQHRWLVHFRYEWGFYLQPNYLGQDLLQFLNVTKSVTPLVWFGVLTAYSIGQFCSMLLRSEILAGFVALVLAVVLSAWVAVLFAWQLSVWQFLLPLATGLLLATWLRSPDWIAGRNSWRAWVKPALAVVGSLVVLGYLLPEERLAQIRRARSPLPGQIGQALDTPESAAFLTRWKAEGEATAEMYLKAAAMLQGPVADSPLEPWSGPEYADTTAKGMVGGIDEKRIPTDQLEAFLAAKHRLVEQLFQQREDAIKLAIEASERPTCRFKFYLSSTHWDSSNPSRRPKPDNTYKALDDLLIQLTTGSFRGEVTFERLLAGLRMSAHLRTDQPTEIFICQLRWEQEILKQIGDWATEKERTNEERRAAIAKLQEQFRSRSELAGALEADQKLIRDVITGKELPFVLSEEPVPMATYLAFVGNELPWERERALKALEVITNQNLTNAFDLANFLSRTTTHDVGPNVLRRWLRPDYQPAAWMSEQPAAVTGYLVSLEYNARVQINELFRQYCDTKTWQQAALIEIALAMYRHDHDEYPETLAALVPEYLDREPLDPYSMQPFSYLPRGLDEPLRTNGYAQDYLQIDAHTPLFWSVGPSDIHLHRRDYDEIRTDEEHPEADPVRERGTFFVLEAVEDWFRYSLVFPLPK